MLPQTSLAGAGFFGRFSLPHSDEMDHDMSHSEKTILDAAAR